MKKCLRYFIGVSIIFLAACTSASAPNENQMPTAIQRLRSLPLPDEWTRVETIENSVVAFTLKNDDIRDDAFIARILPGVCDEEFAQNEVKMNWGENVPAQYKPTALRVDGAPVGYTWSAFDGVAGDATEPGYIHWCIHQAEPNMDIDISVTRSREREKRFVEETFIPLWLQQNSES